MHGGARDIILEQTARVLCRSQLKHTVICRLGPYIPCAYCLSQLSAQYGTTPNRHELEMAMPCWVSVQGVTR
jgi:hypothetical protein